MFEHVMYDQDLEHCFQNCRTNHRTLEEQKGESDILKERKRQNTKKVNAIKKRKGKEEL